MVRSFRAFRRFVSDLKNFTLKIVDHPIGEPRKCCREMFARGQFAISVALKLDRHMVVQCLVLHLAISVWDN